MFWQQLINGLTLGSTYALIALGYTMVYGIVQLINFAHGEIYMFGAFVGLFLVLTFEVNIFIAILGAMIFCMVLGMLVERVAYRPLRGSSRLSALISAIGVSIFLSTLMVLIRGPNVTSYPSDVIEIMTYSLGAIEVSSLQVVILVTASVLMLGLQIMVHRTKIGKAMRACSQDLDAARLMGINVDRVISFTFALGSALAAAGGVMVGIYYNAVQPYMGLMAGLKAFAAAVLGGIGSVPGAMAGVFSWGPGEPGYCLASHTRIRLPWYSDPGSVYPAQGLFGKATTKKIWY